MEFKGTQGEWKAELDKSLYFKIKVEPDLYVEIYDDEYSKSGVLEANANLIAAAPELLNASIKMSKAISDGNNMLLSEANLDMKIAINKALGNIHEEINDKK